ncbi:MAG TPA: alpha/beta hydrolase [Nocardioidaceae bacterium]|nr:alpha/beta hydrolase [Nocardioidaceae bacterium]
MRLEDGRELHVRRVGPPSDLPVVVVHGFPGSSADWEAVAPLLERDTILFDLPGYGRSDKSRDASYSLFDQANVVEEMLRKLGVTRCSLLAHDMGNTVTAELASRHNSGRLGFAIEGIVLTNGSIFIDLAQLTRGQRLTLRLPNRPSLFSLPTWVMRRSLMESFTKEAPPPAGAVDELIAQTRLGGGERLMPVLIRYIEERRVHQEHWTAGFVEYDGPLTLVWGELDPIAVLPMTERMKQLRPATRVVTMPGVGHWPSIEAPALLAEHLRTALLPTA